MKKKSQKFKPSSAILISITQDRGNLQSYQEDNHTNIISLPRKCVCQATFNLEITKFSPKNSVKFPHGDSHPTIKQK